MTPERWQEVKAALHDCLGLEEEPRAAYLRGIAQRDAGLREELDSLLAADARAGADFLDTPAPVGLLAEEPRDRLAGRRLGPYRLVAQIGSGGMGEVYRAVRADEQYHQEVAIKIVRSSLDPSFVAGRLRAERQILASFDHPNIARLLDGGTTDEGVPFLVMELISGKPITAYCDEARLDLNARLELFAQVCAAVQYAHQRMVIHRDLKPGNILVTSGGVPKLLDFGIAKILDPGAMHVRPDLTINALRVLTPQYASPEQLRGEPVTAASDVYSLGVILYELLTGSTPFAGDRLDRDPAKGAADAAPARPSTIVLARDLSGAPTRAPRLENATGMTDGLRRRLRGDLDNIVLMALRTEPERRYATVAQFAEDIRRHLARLPVIARRDTLGYRASRFFRRNTAAVAATALVGLALIIGIVMTTREARLAELQRARAERRFDDVRKLANSLIFDIHDSLRDLPGAAQSRRVLIGTAMQYLDSLTQESSGDPALQRELAAAYTRLGDVQGRALEASEGDYPGALKSYRRALTLLQSSTAARPDNPDGRRDLIVVSGKLSDLLWNTGDPEGALRFSRETILNSRLLVAAQGTSDTQAQRLLASTLMDYGYKVFEIHGDSATALDYMRQSIPALQALTAAAPSDPRPLRTLALAHSRMAEILSARQAYTEALSTDETAHNLYRKLVAMAPRNTDFAHLAAFADYDTAGVLIKLGRLREAREHAQSALTSFRALAASDAKIEEYRLDVGRALATLADLEEHESHPQHAIEVLQESLQQTAVPADANSGIAYAALARAHEESLLADAYAALAADAHRPVAERSKDRQSACSWDRQSLALLEKLRASRADAAELAGRVSGQLQSCDAVTATSPR